MKNLLTAALGISCFALFSCQKEVNDIFSNNTNTGSNGNSTGLLVKTVSVTGTDSMVTLYTYDNQKRLETMTMDGISNGMQMHSYKKYIRDASSRIAKVLQVVEQNGLASDTSIERVHYPGSAMEFDYTVNPISMSGLTVFDSTVYSYSSGKMISMLSNLTSPLLGPAIVARTKTDFAYDAAGNITVLKMYADLGSGTLSPFMNQTYTYGAAINATWISTNSAQNFLLAGTPATGNKAFIKAQMDDLTDPSNSFTMTATYTLDAGNKPKSAMVTSTTGEVTKYTFFYQ